MRLHPVESAQDSICHWWETSNHLHRERPRKIEGSQSSLREQWHHWIMKHSSIRRHISTMIMEVGFKLNATKGIGNQKPKKSHMHSEDLHLSRHSEALNEKKCSENSTNCHMTLLRKGVIISTRNLINLLNTPRSVYRKQSNPWIIQHDRFIRNISTILMELGIHYVQQKSLWN